MNKVELRKALSSIGYSIRFTKHSDFIGAKITHKETGKALDSMMTRKDYDLHAATGLLALRDSIKGKCFEGEYRIVL